MEIFSARTFSFYIHTSALCWHYTANFSNNHKVICRMSSISLFVSVFCFFVFFVSVLFVSLYCLLTYCLFLCCLRKVLALKICTVLCCVIKIEFVLTCCVFWPHVLSKIGTISAIGFFFLAVSCFSLEKASLRVETGHTCSYNNNNGNL